MSAYSGVQKTCFVVCGIAAFQIAVLVYYFVNSQSGFDFSGQLVGRDFVNIYFGGRFIEQDQIDILFQQGEYHSKLRDWLGAEYPVHSWSYPPSLFLFASLLSRLPYFAAYIVWTAGGVALLSLVLRKLGLSWIWVACIVFSPAGVSNILAGQNGFYTSALLVAAITVSHKNRKISAGLLWALATVKPHLGLLAIPLLLSLRRFGVIFSAVIFSTLFVAGVVFIYGFDPWVKYFSITAKFQVEVIENWTGFLRYISPTGFMQGRLLGLPTSAAYVLHTAYSIVTLGLLVWGRPRATTSYKWWLTWFVLGTLLLLPYSFVYDFVIFQVILALWKAEPHVLLQIRCRETARGIWLALWIFPVISVGIAVLISIQLTPLVFLWMLWRFGLAVNSDTAPQKNQDNSVSRSKS